MIFQSTVLTSTLDQVDPSCFSKQAFKFALAVALKQGREFAHRFYEQSSHFF